MRPTRVADTGGSAVRRDVQTEALATDRYLDGMLAAEDRRPRTVEPDAAATPSPGGGPDADMRRAAGVLRASLVRVHPSFRFEERLAQRLASLAAWGVEAAPPAARPRTGAVIPFPALAARADPLLEAVLDGRLDPADDGAVAAASLRSPARPLLVGGAITSAAISIAGIAWVAWRAWHSSAAPMSRAVRTARARRPAGLSVGGHGGPA